MDSITVIIGYGYGVRGTLTTDHTASSNGQPVLIVNGDVFGPRDLIKVGKAIKSAASYPIEWLAPANEIEPHLWPSDASEFVDYLERARARENEAQQMIDAFCTVKT